MLSIEQVFSNHKKSVELYDIGGEPFIGQLLNSFQIRSTSVLVEATK